MAYEWPVDKLTLVNSALVQTGNNLVNIADDGSEEWRVCSAAYERGLAYIMENHNWGFAAIVKILQPSPTKPVNVQWDTAYQLPPDLAHLIWVRETQNTDATSRVTPSATLYDIENVGGFAMLVLNAQGGPPPPDIPQTPVEVTIKYISQTYSDPTGATPTFVLALETFIMAGIYRGLHDDLGEAKAMAQMAHVILGEARSTYDRQKPKRSMFNSRLTAARRIRRPWVSRGNDEWGGSGVPN